LIQFRKQNDRNFETNGNPKHIDETNQDDSAKHTRPVVETEHGRTEEFHINTGLRQGDVLSTLLFN